VEYRVYNNSQSVWRFYSAGKGERVAVAESPAMAERICRLLNERHAAQESEV
jgi:hypothetical protein